MTMREIADFLAYWWIVIMLLWFVVCLLLWLHGNLTGSIASLESNRADLWRSRWNQRSSQYARKKTRR